MKISGKKINTQAGGSTVELMVALFVFVVCLAGIIAVVFGNQFLSVDTEMNGTAIAKAQELLDEKRNDARTNFNGVVAGVSTDGQFTKTVAVNNLNQCQKEVTSEVSWNDGTRLQKVSLTTLISNTDELVAVSGVCSNQNGFSGLTCPSTSSYSDWNFTLPGGGTVKSMFVTSRIVSLAVDPSGTAITDFDYLRFTVSSGLVFNNGTFTRTPSGVRTSSGGLNGVTYDNSKTYAYGAGKWSGAGQVQIINADATRPGGMYAIAFVLDSNTQDALSIFFRDNKIYIGTKNNPSGPELYIIDVTSPESAQILATKEIGADVKKIVVRGSLAYLATSDPSAEARVYDIGQVKSIALPGVINFVGNFNASLLSGANSLAVLGATVFLGGSGANNFYEINTLNASSMSEITHQPIGGSINDLSASGNLAYLATDGANVSGKELELLNYADISSPQTCAIGSEDLPASASAVVLDGGWVYVGMNASNKPLRIYKFQ